MILIYVVRVLLSLDSMTSNFWTFLTKAGNLKVTANVYSSIIFSYEYNITNLFTNRRQPIVTAIK